MKITVAKPDLEDALQVASITLSPGDELTAYFLFRHTDGHTEVLTTNTRACSAVPLTCVVEDEGDGTMNIEGWRLQQWLGGIGDVAVTMEAEGPGIVKLTSPRSTVRLRSRDAQQFPYWDKTLAEGVAKATIAADRLASAFNYASNFVYDRDTTSPTITQIEVVDGALWSTDKKAISKITVPELANCTFRIHAKDIVPVTKFLSLKGTEKVTVIEHDRMVFFRRDDGALVGAARPQSSFPKLNSVDSNDRPEIEWDVLTSDILAGIQCLKASAEKGNEVLRFDYDTDAKTLVLGVASMAGGEDVYPVEASDVAGVDNIPEGGFKLDFPYLQRIIGHFGGDSLHFAANRVAKKKGAGYVRFNHVANGDEYLTVVVWRT